MKRLLGVLALAAFGFSAPAAAAVIYDFTANTSTSGSTGSFRVTTDDFLTTNTSFSVSELDFCIVSEGDCRSQTFGVGSSYDVVVFGAGSVYSYYYFNPGSFGGVGTYDTVLFGADQAGRLVVSESLSAIPEPTTWVMMIGGFALAGSAMRRRRPAAAAAVIV